jgi:hypothetical protein
MLVIECFKAEGRGVLGTVRRWLSTDFGCYFLGPDLVCTTDVALANFGFGDDELGEVTNDSIPALTEDVRSFADQLGKFLADKFPLSSHADDDAGLLRKLPPLRQEDHRALDAYSRLAARLGVDDVQLAVQFSYLVSQVNFVHLGLPSLLRRDSDLLFRFQFLTMFHVSGELRRLGAVTSGVRSHKLGRFAADVPVPIWRPQAKKPEAASKCNGSLRLPRLGGIGDRRPVFRCNGSPGRWSRACRAKSHTQSRAGGRFELLPVYCGQRLDQENEAARVGERRTDGINAEAARSSGRPSSRKTLLSAPGNLRLRGA